MRWQQLFADLRAQFDEGEAGADRAESASRARAELGAVRLAERLGGTLGCTGSLRCRGAAHVSVLLADVGADWLLLEQAEGRESLDPTRAVITVGGLGRQT